jgi:hypothetical protein
MLTRFIDFLDDHGFTEPELTAGILVGVAYGVAICTLISFT